MHSIIRHLVTFLVAIVALSVVVTSVAPVAAQAPTCETGIEPTYRYASYSICYDMAHRAAIYCQTYSSGTNWYYDVDWHQPYEKSIAICPQDTVRIVDYSYDYPD